MAYIVTLNNVTGPDVVSLTDGTTYATLTVNTNAISPVVADTSPQLGGDLDLNGNDITGTGNINITGTLDTSGNVTVGGNLTVNGTTTTINSTTLTVDDLNVVVASGAADAAAANGAGLTVDGANATLTYVSSGDKWALNKPLDITGTVTATGFVSTGNLTFGDNNKAIFGAGSDLQIYHDGSHSYVQDAGSGNLYLRQNGTAVIIDDGTNNLAAFNSVSGESALYYGASGKKLATTSTGVDVTGTVTADGLTVDGSGIAAELRGNNTSLTYNNKLRFTDTDTSLSAGQSVGRIEFYTSDISSAGVAGYIDTYGYNGAEMDLLLGTGAGGNALDRVRIAYNGNIQFFEDTGTTPKLTWDASAEALGIGTSSPTDGIEIWMPSAAIKVHDTSTVAQDVGGKVNLSGYYTGTTENTYAQILGAKENATDANRRGYFSIKTRSLSAGLIERLRVDSNGNVGIGTSSPDDYKLHILRGSPNLLHLESTSATASLDFTNSGGTASLISQNANLLFSNGSERMRLDASGNLLVGTTNNTSSTAGFKWRQDLSRLITVADGGSSASFGRLTSDGEIVLFQKDGTTVGSIGAVSGDAFIQTGGYGIRFSDAAQAIRPCNSTGGANTAMDVGDATVPWRNLYLSGGLRGDTLTFSNLAGTERLRIDSSGNVLVGTTSNPSTIATTAGANGIGVSADDYIAVSRSGGTTLNLNRTTSDGDIAVFRKNGTTVGSIGSYAGNQTYITSLGGGIKFNWYSGTQAAIEPCSTSGAPADNLHDLGGPSARWQDLYLSGGVYLGGTGAANKLDDYETGTWTPVIEGSTTAGTGTYTIQEGNYVKIGRLVYFQFYVQWTAHTGTGNLNHSLPFSVNNTGSNFPPCSAHTDNIALSASHYSSSSVLNELGYGQLKQYPVGGGAQANVPMDTAGGMLVSGTYYTT